jgi:hypothetical protein
LFILPFKMRCRSLVHLASRSDTHVRVWLVLASRKRFIEKQESLPAPAPPGTQGSHSMPPARPKLQYMQPTANDFPTASREGMNMRRKSGWGRGGEGRGEGGNLRLVRTALLVSRPPRPSHRGIPSVPRSCDSTARDKNSCVSGE